MARGEGTLVRRDGRLQHIPFGSASIDVDYGRGVSSAMAASWGDVATAYHSTGIPNVSVYMTFAGATGYLSKFAGPLVSLLRLPGATAIAGHLIRMGEPGPDEVTRTRGYCLLWGRVRDADGNAVTSRMRTPEGYTFTVRSALWAAERVVAGRVTPGFHTPTTAFGADVALKFDGVERSDVAD